MSDNEKIAFARDALEHNNSIINLIDTKSGLVLGASGIILGLLTFFERDGLGYAIFPLFVTMGLLLGTIMFSFFTIFPRITKKFKGETAIFYPAITKLSMSEFEEKLKKYSTEDILKDYANNIHSLAKVQERKFEVLRISMGFMIASSISLVITLICYFQNQPISQ
ncbi:hypothetical protein C5F49_05180 [Nitrosopumilus oxyclinae]|uniref:Pycsar effector protein domain-containing protein n=1 Tax=Nitrosopumilus oxyclinae TaxID=1959104 RepID=A0A7D5M1K7_9ARCH|nr:Pycsar system effector family protein [Nitrosopumilus oxyclinae]QLH04773.1 hypothetical protein C5F49_05180 [Nitrosopumilus oxyclinae]